MQLTIPIEFFCFSKLTRTQGRNNNNNQQKKISIQQISTSNEKNSRNTHRTARKVGNRLMELALGSDTSCVGKERGEGCERSRSLCARRRSGSFFLVSQVVGARGRNTGGHRTVEESRGQFLYMHSLIFFLFFESTFEKKREFYYLKNPISRLLSFNSYRLIKKLFHYISHHPKRQMASNLSKIYDAKQGGGS